MHKKVFKSLYVLVAIALVAASMAGCTTSPAAQTASPAAQTASAAATTAVSAAATASEAPTATASPTPAPVTITWWFPLGDDTNKPPLEQAAVEFTKANPNIIVKAEYVADEPTKLQVAINAGTPPDVCEFDRFLVGQWADQGLLTDLDDLCSKYGITKDMFYDGPMNEASLKGKVYALPFDTDTRAFFWNKKLFKEAGLDPEKPPTTIADLDAYAEKLTKKDGDRYTQIGFIPWYGEGSIYTYGWAFGGQFIDASGKITANDPKIADALTWMVGYAKKYNIERLNNFQTSAGDIDPFTSGKLAMCVAGYWIITGFGDKASDYGVGYIPTPTGDNFHSWAGGNSFIIPSGVKNVDAAMQFAKYMCCGQGGKTYAEPTISFLSNKALNESLNWVKSTPNAQFFTNLLPISYCRPVITQGQLLWDELASARDMALNSKGDPKELLTAVTDKINKALNK